MFVEIPFVFSPSSRPSSVVLAVRKWAQNEISGKWLSQVAATHDIYLLTIIGELDNSDDGECWVFRIICTNGYRVEILRVLLTPFRFSDIVVHLGATRALVVNYKLLYSGTPLLSHLIWIKYIIIRAIKSAQKFSYFRSQLKERRDLGWMSDFILWNDGWPGLLRRDDNAEIDNPFAYPLLIHCHGNRTNGSKSN